MKKILWMLCALFFSFSCKAEVLAEGVSAVQGEITARFEAATENYQSQVYIDDLQIPVSTENEDALTELCDNLLEEIPSSYYVFRVSLEADASNSYYRKITLISSMKDENGDLDFERLLAYENAVDNALSYTTPEMSDLDKAVVLYNYVIKNCEYDDYSSSGSATSYGALVDGLAVCQGYALAYIDLLDRVGIEAKYVRSNPMNHGWCLVQIDGSWYHADPTWDDKGGNEVGYEYFLRSDAEMEERMHSDWMTYYLPEVGPSNAFDDCIFRSSGATAYHNGEWYYVAEDEGIYSSDIRHNKQQKCLDGAELCYTYFMKDKVYLVNTTGIYVAEGYNFDAMTAVSTWGELYPDRALRVTSVEVAEGILKVSVAFKDNGENDEYLLEIGQDKQPEQIGFIVAFESDCSTVITVKEDVTKGSLLEEPEALTKDGYTFMGWYADGALTDPWDFTTDTVEGNIMLYAKWKPLKLFLEDDDIFIAYGKTRRLYLLEEVRGMTYVWESADESIATVTQDGLVESVSGGETTIKVYLQEDPSVYTLCQVEVGSKCSLWITPYCTELYMINGERQILTAEVQGSTTEDTTITWTTEDESVVQVSDGVVTAVGPGVTNITAEAKGTDALPWIIKIDVTRNYSLYISLGSGSDYYSINVGGECEVQATAYSRLMQENVPADAISWTSADESIVKYVDGHIVGVGVGETTITVEVPGTDAEPIVLTVSVYDNSSAPTATPSPSGQEAQVYAFVERMYTVAFGRASDTAGAQWWTEQLLVKNYDGASLSVGFIMSEEFAGKNYSNEEYVTVLYSTFFDRVADEGGKAHWATILENGSTRAEVLAGFVNSDEFFEICASYGISKGVLRGDGSAVNPGIYLFAERLYTKVFERGGERSGMEYWSLQIDSRECTPEDAARGFFFSSEYESKQTTDEEYIMALYRTFMGREAEDSGLTYWLGQMTGGMSREAVLSSFAYSDEFKGIMEEYGL